MGDVHADAQSVTPETGFFRELRGLDVRGIQAFLDSQSHVPFEDSEVYLSADDQNVVDKSQRRSKFRKFVDGRLFDLLEPVVAQLSMADPLMSYNLVRNDVTNIKYEVGGFFTKHTDYCSLTSNVLEEFSMLVCVTPAVHVKPGQGGATIIHMHRLAHVSDATTTPGCAIAFRKDLEHEGAVVTAGEKHIVMLNLWATRKDSHGVLLVHFDEHPHAATESALRLLASGHIYTIAIREAVRSPRLASYIQSCEKRETNAVLRYACKECSYEAFGTIFNILRRMYVPKEQVQEHAKLISFYGLDSEHILLNPSPSAPLMLEAARSMREWIGEIRISMISGSVITLRVEPDATIEHLKTRLEIEAGLQHMSLFMPGSGDPLKDFDTIASCGYPTELFTMKKMRRADEYELMALTDEERGRTSPDVLERHSIDDDGSDVILCESLARSKVVAEAAVKAGLPFVSFQVLLIEGELRILGDTARPCKHSFHMEPAFISVGDSQQLLGWGCIKHNWTGSKRWWENDPDKRKFPKNPALFDLQRALKPDVNITDVMRCVFGEVLPEPHYPGSGGEVELEEEQEEERDVFGSVLEMTVPSTMDEADDHDGQLFQVNSNGQTCFSAQQAVLVSAYLREILFIDQLKERIHKVPWHFPQDSKHRSERLCNERVYGHANVIMVSGVVRLKSEGDEDARQKRREFLRERYPLDEEGGGSESDDLYGDFDF